MLTLDVDHPSATAYPGGPSVLQDCGKASIAPVRTANAAVVLFGTDQLDNIADLCGSDAAQHLLLVLLVYSMQSVCSALGTFLWVHWSSDDAEDAVRPNIHHVFSSLSDVCASMFISP
jgi:hypothetical protein